MCGCKMRVFVSEIYKDNSSKNGRKRKWKQEKGMRWASEEITKYDENMQM